MVQASNGTGQAIAGVDVSFNISATPQGATGTALETTTCRTDTSGQCGARLTLGSAPGVYTVTALAGDANGKPLVGSPLQFQALTRPPATLSKSSGNSQYGTAGKPLGRPMVASVKDSDGNPVGGVAVNFAVSASPAGATGASVTPPAVVTDGNGLAQATLTLGSALGSYTVTASAGSLGGATVTFEARAVQAVQLAMVSGDAQTGATLQPLGAPLVVRATDAAGNRVAGVDVSWAVTQAPAGATGFALLPAACATDADGDCRVTLFAGSEPGAYAVVATAAGLAPPAGVQFTATAQIKDFIAGAYDGAWTGRTAQADAQPRPMGFTIRNSTITAYSIEFRLPQCGVWLALSNNTAFVPLVNNQFALTEQFVRKTITLILSGNLASPTQASGTFSVTDTSCGGSASGTWTATAPQMASRVRIAGGNNQVGAVNAKLAASLVIQVTDASGNPQASQTVTFAVTGQPQDASGAILSPPSATTDANGRASVGLTLGGLQGIYEVTATGPAGDRVALLATAKPAAPAKTIKRSGDNQTGAPGSVLPVPICVTVTDEFNNAVPDLAVSFSISSQPSGGNATLSVAAASTATHGAACTRMTGGHQLGSYLEETGFPGTALLPLTFTISVSQPASLEKAGVDNQSAQINTTLANPLLVRVKDTSGNAVAGVAVAFAVTGAPAGATGASVNPASCTSDVNGQCQAALTLGSVAGVYAVTATAADTSGNPLAGSPLQFQATALAAYMVGDTFPFGTDPHANLLREEVGEFGDNQLTIQDLIYALRAVTSIPGYRPRSCSDRYDAIDSFPKDTEAVRGGDGILNTVDLIYTLRRVTSVDASRPVRMSRGLACPAQAPGQVAAQAFQPVLPAEAAGRLELGLPQAAEGGGAMHVPVYLQAARDLELAGLSFSIGMRGLQPGTWNLKHGTAPPPTLIDADVPGMLAVAWLEGLQMAAGQRLLLGYVVAPGLAPGTDGLQFMGISANAPDGSEVRVAQAAVPVRE
jgi:hypothetical protein